MPREFDVHEYYRTLTSQDIGAVARELLGERITGETATDITVDCPNHQSASKRSLHVSTDRGLWNCFACGKGGDLLQLVEFVKTGQVTAGQSGRMTDSHRESRDWLAQRAGLPALGRAGMSAEEIERAEVLHREATAVFAAMTAIAEHYCQELLTNDAHAPVLSWLREQYGITREDVEELRIGYADDPGLFAGMEKLGIPARDLAGTGCFSFDQQDHPHPFFVRRVVFPYWSRGRVAYMTGRRTPWSDSSSQWERAKYKKLPVHNPRNRAFVSKLVDNSVLMGEDVLLSNPKFVVITEGVTDYIAGRKAGLPIVSVTSARFRGEDLARVVRRLRKVPTVYIVQDTELSSIGITSSLETSRAMEREGVNCLVATLPIGPEQEAARAELGELVGETQLVQILSAPPAKIPGLMKASAESEEDRKRAELLVDRCKVDMCGWFLAGGTREEFDSILKDARRAIEVSIEIARPTGTTDAERVHSIEDILVEIGLSRPADQADLLRALKGKTGIAVGVLRKEVAAASREEKARQRSAGVAGVNMRTVTESEEGTLRAIVESACNNARAHGDSPPWEKIADEAYDWFVANGGQFFRLMSGAPLLFYENEIWPMAAHEKGPRSRYEGLIYRLAGLVPTQTGPRTFYAVLAALASDRGEIRETFPWVHANVGRSCVWLNQNVPEQTILMLQPGSVDVVPNGSNDDQVILTGDAKFRPFTFDPDVREDELDELLEQFIGRHLACPYSQREPLLLWLLCFPLIEYAGTRPMVRLEGDPGSGKTWAAKMLTTLVYGTDTQKKSTDAANFADAARNPLIALDNVETANTTQGLLDFLLTAVTGITREKRTGGTDSGITSEKPLCLVMSTGVEPLGGELEEVMSRSVVFEFNSELQEASLIEPQVLEAIRKNRARILSALMLRTSTVLDMISQGGHAAAIQAIRTKLGKHPKSRCDEWLALMYLHHIASKPDHQRMGMLDALDPKFESVIRGLNDATGRITRDASPVVTCMISLFVAMRAHGTFARDVGLNTNDAGDQVRNASAAMLFLAMQKLRRDRGITVPWDNAVQFGRRLSAAIKLLTQQGFTVQRSQNSSRTWLYSISWNHHEGGLSSDTDEGVDVFSTDALDRLEADWAGASAPPSDGADQW